MFYWAGLNRLSKPLIQFSVDGQGCVPSLMFDLGPNYGGGNEDNGDLLQKIPCMHCCTQCPRPCSRPPPTLASTGDSWTLMGKSRSVSCGVIAPIFWVLVHTRFCLCPPRASYPYPSEGRQNEKHNHRKLIKLITWTTALSNSMKL